MNPHWSNPYWLRARLCSCRPQPKLVSRSQIQPAGLECCTLLLIGLSLLRRTQLPSFFFSTCQVWARPPAARLGISDDSGLCHCCEDHREFPPSSLKVPTRWLSFRLWYGASRCRRDVDALPRLPGAANRREAGSGGGEEWGFPKRDAFNLCPVTSLYVADAVNSSSFMFSSDEEETIGCRKVMVWLHHPPKSVKPPLSRNANHLAASISTRQHAIHSTHRIIRIQQI